MKKLELQQIIQIERGKTILQGVNYAIGLIGLGATIVGLATATEGLGLATAVFPAR